MTLVQISKALSEDLACLDFSLPVVHVYNPLQYAWKPHEQYLVKYGGGAKEVVFVGMNPGPWGMAQTGVPFGEVSIVREWLEISEPISRPAHEHPKKRVQGFDCRRSEVSGKRLWGLIRERFETPLRFFSRFFVLNYCPLLFLDGHGRNLTPDKLRPAERAALLSTCDGALRLAVECLQPKLVIGIGNFAAERARNALDGTAVQIGKIIHPSPSNPTANRCWQELALKQLHEQGVLF